MNPSDTGLRHSDVTRSRRPLLAKHSPFRAVNHLRAESQTDSLIWFVLLHAPLGILFYQEPSLSVLWGYVVIGTGVATVLLGNRSSMLPLFVLTYLCGGEMMWRLLFVAPALPYEVGKYALFLIAAIGTIRRYKSVRDWPAIPLLFLLCLLPSMIMWVGDEDLTFARKAFFGTLLPPIVLAIGTIYIQGRKLDHATATRLALIIIAPIVSVVAIATYNTWIQESRGLLYFGRSSNVDAAGGTGPNQVSNTLAFGALFCWLVIVHSQVSQAKRLVLTGLAVWMVGQALLTFSRGGVVTLGVSIATSVLVSLSITKGRTGFPVRNLLWLGLIALVVALVIWPWAERFTSGRLSERYDTAETDTSGRTEIAMAEIEMWKSSPILGIGIGKVREETENYLTFGAASHTEFTRLLAEHGVFGLMAVILFFAGLWQNLVRAKDVRARSWIAGLGVFAILYMSQAATRTIAPVIAYMLTWAVLFAPSQDEEVLSD